MDNLKEASCKTLLQLVDLLKDLDENQYRLALTVFRGASIGKHIRHIIEFYQCLFDARENIVNYDLRLRDTNIEVDKDVAIDRISEIITLLSEVTADNALELHTNYTIDGRHNSIFKSSFLRELAYNLEHTIHHMAILRIGIESFLPEYEFPENFGIAVSTLRDQKQTQGV